MILVFLSFFSVLKTQASYFKGKLSTQNDNEALGAHLIIAGKGLEIGDQWLTIAHTQALIFKDKAQHGPIILIAAIDKPSYQEKLKDWGYTDIKVYNQTFTGDRLIEQIAQISRISSIDYIGHNGALYGLALEDYNNRFFLTHAEKLAAYKNKFTPDSYIRLMGCNTGWNLAPKMAELLNVPVAGSFTFADIQDLYNDGSWYYHDKGRYPEGAKHDSVNRSSYTTPTSCQHQAGCSRLKVVTIPYQGKHGTYKMTLPFLKFFCGNLDRERCTTRMAKSVSTLISSTSVLQKPNLAQYSEIVADNMCNSWLDFNRRQDCFQKVMDHMSDKKTLPAAFNTINDKLLSCTTKTCLFKKDCSSGSCVMEGTDTGKPSTTFVDELNLYKEGFRYL